MTTRILVVDDEPDIVGILDTYLHRFLDDFELTSASNGEEALEQVSKMIQRGEPPHITLMDLKMPVMDGIKCTKQLTEIGLKNVYILTAYVDKDMISNAVASGAKGLLMKSEGLRTVATKVAEMLRSMRLIENSV